MDSQKRSAIWIYFSSVANEKAKCNLCKNIYSFRGSVTNLRKHIKSKHPTMMVDDEPKMKRQSLAVEQEQRQLSVDDQPGKY